jgi:hypothetical protein
MHVNQKVLDRAVAILEEDMDTTTGICLACWEEQEGCEPDARNYECESCGEKQVFGAQEIVLMGA